MAERESTRLRRELGLGPAATLDVQKLASHLDIKVVSADQLIARARLEELERIQTFSFSAATVEIRGRNYIVTSPLAPSASPVSFPLRTCPFRSAKDRLMDHRAHIQGRKG